MTQQTKHDPGALSPSLHAKLQAFADGLTPEEVAQLRTLPLDDVTGLLSPALRAKAQQAAEALRPQEAVQLTLLLQRAGVGAPADADAQGYMKREYLERDMPPDSLGGTGGPGLSAPTILIYGLIAAGALTGAGYGDS